MAGTASRAAAALIAGAALAASLMASGSAPAAGPVNKPAPNVVVLMTDDQTQAAIAAMPRTRALVGAPGATFRNSFVSFPLCCPSRATFLTGQYAHNHRVLENYPPRGGFQSLDSSETLPVWLSRAGYFTGQIGKLMNGYNSSPVGVPPGWAEWHGEKTENRYYGYRLYENGGEVTYGDPNEDPSAPDDPASYSTDVYTAKAVDFIQRRAPAAAPFFLWVSYNAPHSGQPNPPEWKPERCRGNAKPAARHLDAYANAPLPTRPNFNEADVADKPPTVRHTPLLDGRALVAIRNIYRCELAALQAVDEGVERVMETLEASGELADTYVVFTSDNGFFHGEHRIVSGKNRFYEEAIRVPLMIRGPGIEPGAEVNELVGNVDLAATITDIAGADPGVPQDGRSLLPILDRPERLRGRELLLDTNTYKGIRNAEYAYVEHFARGDAGRRELYDLGRDPFQLDSLHRGRRYAEVRRALHRRLNKLRRCDGRECRLRPRLRLKGGGDGSCRPRFVRVELAGKDADAALKARFSLAGRARVDRRDPFRAQLPLRSLKRGRALVEAVVTLIDGRVASVRRRIRC